VPRAGAGLARAVAGTLLGLVVQFWIGSLRLRVVAHPELEAARTRPWVLAFWHGTQLPLLAWRRRRTTVVLVSLSRDGGTQARVLALNGLRVVRGSSSLGGVRGLVALIREMKRHAADAAFAVDGPHGPRGVAKPGAVLAARATGGVVVPMTSVVHRGTVLHKAWDKFTLAWPFSRVDVVLGRPIDPAAEPDARAQVQCALETLDREAMV
jgi:lysophospholipid acyltransferase (LPLAT)-like uncharacterized protein